MINQAGLRSHIIKFLPTISLLVIIAYGIFLRGQFISQPMRYDEAYTYMHYARFTPHTILTDYSYPNNHIFHTLLVHTVTELAGNSPKAIRTPAFLAGILCIPLAYLVVRALHSRESALIASVLTATSSYLIEYSTNARGYTIIAATTLAALYATHRALHTKKIAWWCGVVFFISMGAWTIPTMLYPASGILVWIGIELFRTKQKQNLWIFLALIGALVLGSSMLYIPLLLKSGITPLIHNGFVEPTSWATFTQEILNALSSLWRQTHRDVPLIITLLFVSSAVWACFFRFKKVFLFVIIFLIPLLIILLGHTLPPTRVLLFLLPIYYAIASIGIIEVILKIKKMPEILHWSAPVGTLILLFLLGSSVESHKSILFSTETGFFPNAEHNMNVIARTYVLGDSTRTTEGDAVYDYYGFLLGLSNPPSGFKTNNLYIAVDNTKHQETETVIRDILKRQRGAFSVDAIPIIEDEYKNSKVLHFKRTQ